MMKTKDFLKFIVLFFVIVIPAYFILAYRPETPAVLKIPENVSEAIGTGQQVTTVCQGAGVKIEKIECEDGILRITILNNGTVKLPKKYIIFANFDVGVFFTAQELVKQLGSGEVGMLIFPVQGSGSISYLKISSSDCANVNDEKNILGIKC